MDDPFHFGSDDPAPHPRLPPVSLELRLLLSVVQRFEWIPRPGIRVGQELCLVCGSTRARGHVRECPVGRAVFPGKADDGLTGTATDAVFLLARRRSSMSVPLDMLAYDLRELEAKVNRVQALLPRGRGRDRGSQP